jgi:PAS domain S-box-containing protein/putative nucleotidyltransferase with HDIG domain
MKKCKTHETERRDHLLLAAKEWHECFDAIPEMILLMDTEFRVLRANKAAHQGLGMKPGQIAGQSCFRLIHGAEEPPDYCPHLRAKTTGEPQAARIEEPHLGRTLSMSVFPVKDDEGGVVSVLEVINDVTIDRDEQREATRLTEALSRSFSGITEAISDLAERRDPYTAGHARGVAVLATRIAREMGMEEDDLQGIKVCATLHDIGKITISSGILNKSGRLSKNEWGIIETHSATAYEVLCRIDFPWPVAEVVYQHQERLDGSGYPRRLRGDEIHPWARILAVADVIDAMMTHRPYRPALSKREALNEIKKGREKLYDEKVVDAAIRLLTKEDRRILVVDDEPAVVSLYMKFLQCMDLNLEVQGFTESSEALKAFIEQPFPLVITDVSMPGMNGLELLRRVREIHPTTKVIIITGLGEKEHTVEALRLGASDFLEKPVQFSAFKSSVETLLKRYEDEE